MLSAAKSAPWTRGEEAVSVQSPWKDLLVEPLTRDHLVQLWRQNLPAAVRLEQLWNELIRSHSIPLLCAYGLAGNGDAPHLFPSDLRTLHSHLIPVEAWP